MQKISKPPMISFISAIVLLGSPTFAAPVFEKTKSSSSYMQSIGLAPLPKDANPWVFSLGWNGLNTQKIGLKTTTLGVGYRIEKNLLAHLEADLSGNYQSISARYLPDHGLTRLQALRHYFSLGATRLKIHHPNKANSYKMHVGPHIGVGVDLSIAHSTWLNAEVKAIAKSNNHRLQADPTVKFGIVHSL